MNRESDLNLTVTEPPLKRLKKEIEKLSSRLEPENVPVPLSELSPSSLKVQLQEDSILLTGSVIRIVLIKLFIYFSFFIS